MEYLFLVICKNLIWTVARTYPKTFILNLLLLKLATYKSEYLLFLFCHSKYYHEMCNGESGRSQTYMLIIRLTRYCDTFTLASSIVLSGWEQRDVNEFRHQICTSLKISISNFIWTESCAIPIFHSQKDVNQNQHQEIPALLGVIVTSTTSHPWCDDYQYVRFILQRPSIILH